MEHYMPSYLVKGQKCVVCGDLATGLHYRAFTCEGCKGFFRRVYQRGADQFECKGQPRGHCPISKSTRNACQRCRQDKCLEGMDPQLVLGEVQRRAKRRLIEGNRERRQLERRQQRIRRALMAPLGGAEAEELKLCNVHAPFGHFSRQPLMAKRQLWRVMASNGTNKWAHFIGAFACSNSRSLTQHKVGNCVGALCSCCWQCYELGLPNPQGMELGLMGLALLLPLFSSFRTSLERANTPPPTQINYPESEKNIFNFF